jgi:hypothetical protein
MANTGRAAYMQCRDRDSVPLRAWRCAKRMARRELYGLFRWRVGCGRRHNGSDRRGAHRLYATL